MLKKLNLNIMKNILFIVLIVIISYNCKAQERPIAELENIIPVENEIIYNNNGTEVPDNTYFKDINNLFNKYIGVWTGSHNNKNYEIITTEYLYNSSIRPLKRDKLIIKYKITDNNGNIVIDTTNLPDDDVLVIEGDYLDENEETYHLYYIGENYKCGQNGYITMAVVNNGTQLNFGLSVEGEMTQSCQTGPAEQIFPELMTLNKQ